MQALVAAYHRPKYMQPGYNNFHYLFGSTQSGLSGASSALSSSGVGKEAAKQPGEVTIAAQQIIQAYRMQLAMLGRSLSIATRSVETEPHFARDVSPLGHVM